MQNPDRTPHRICVVLPTYNNGRTIARVVEDCLRSVSDLIVVDDGSTDATSKILEGIEGISLVAHAVNRGKGAALKSGFSRAIELGFTHAITIDGDGQHRPDELGRFMEVIEANPEAIVLGVRDLRGAGRRLKSRLLRAHSNFWVWAETGTWMQDTQTGFRAYPLKRIDALALRADKYDFEIEVLVKFMWAGGNTQEVPVHADYGPGSTSHFDPTRDFARVARCNAALFFQRFFIPSAVLESIHQKRNAHGSWLHRLGKVLRRTLRHELASPGTFGAALGLGVFCGVVPLWGFQMAFAVSVAHWFGLNKPIVLLASNISIPPMIPLILYSSLLCGRLLLAGDLGAPVEYRAVDFELVWSYAIQYVVGSMALAASAGLLTFVAGYSTARLISSTTACAGGGPGTSPQ